MVLLGVHVQRLFLHALSTGHSRQGEEGIGQVRKNLRRQETGLRERKHVREEVGNTRELLLS